MKNELVSIRPLPMGEITADQIEAFLSVGFTNHALIVEKTKTVDERWYYVLACAKGTWTVEQLQSHLRADDYHHIGALPNNFLKTLSPYQTFAPVIEGVKRILTENAKANVPQKNTKRKGAKK